MQETTEEAQPVEEEKTAEAPETETLSRREMRKKKKAEKPKRPLWQEILSWVWPLLGALVIALVVRTLLFEPVRVDGSSMNDTLANGEIMFVDKTGYSSFWVTWPWGTNEAKEACNKWTFFGGPQRFDPVVCRYPDRGTTNFVKRVVGLPGDTLEVKDGYLYVNGEKYDEPYVSDSYRAGETWGESIQVPKKGDAIAYDGQSFTVNGAAYPYAYAAVKLENNMSIRALHSTMNTADYLYLVKTGGKSYVFYDGIWAEVTATYVSAFENKGQVWYQLNGTSRQKLDAAPTVTGSAVAYYNNEQQPVVLKVETTETAPIKEGNLTVAEDSYFVMGDHRNNSRDSRWCGAIPRSYVMGRVRQVIWPLNKWRGVQNGLEFKAE